MNRFPVVIAALILFFAAPASARPHQHAPPPQVFSLFSLFQVKEESRAHTPRIRVRHVATVRNDRARRVVVVRHGRPSHLDMVDGVSGPLGDSLVETARSQIGNGAIYGRRSLWCARFANWVLEQTGHRGTGSDMARSFARLPRTDMHVGAIAVMSRRGGGHVGFVSGVTTAGDPVVISGNHGGHVRESVYRLARVRAFVNPR